MDILGPGWTKFRSVVASEKEPNVEDQIASRQQRYEALVDPLVLESVKNQSHSEIILLVLTMLLSARQNTRIWRSKDAGETPEFLRRPHK